ncbi:MAG TPA: hypothetical protein VGI39_34060 [Polyangiaceae bacterium]|jgi:hypothetical protein
MRIRPAYSGLGVFHNMLCALFDEATAPNSYGGAIDTVLVEVGFPTDSRARHRFEVYERWVASLPTAVIERAKRRAKVAFASRLDGAVFNPPEAAPPALVLLRQLDVFAAEYIEAIALLDKKRKKGDSFDVESLVAQLTALVAALPRKPEAFQVVALQALGTAERRDIAEDAAARAVARVTSISDADFCGLRTL